jgi:hypothetical protein
MPKYEKYDVNGVLLESIIYDDDMAVLERWPQNGLTPDDLIAEAEAWEAARS